MSSHTTQLTKVGEGRPRRRSGEGRPRRGAGRPRRQSAFLSRATEAEATRRGPGWGEASGAAQRRRGGQSGGGAQLQPAVRFTHGSEAEHALLRLCRTHGGTTDALESAEAGAAGKGREPPRGGPENTRFWSPAEPARSSPLPESRQREGTGKEKPFVPGIGTRNGREPPMLPGFSFPPLAHRLRAGNSAAALAAAAGPELGVAPGQCSREGKRPLPGAAVTRGGWGQLPGPSSPLSPASSA